MESLELLPFAFALAVIIFRLVLALCIGIFIDVGGGGRGGSGGAGGISGTEVWTLISLLFGG